MPIVRSGTFILYGYELTGESTLTDGAHMQIPDPDYWYLCNSGNIVFQPDIPTPMPCDPTFTGPLFLDTTTEGNNWDAGAPPPGFTLKTRPIYTGPVIFGGFGGMSPVNNAGTWSMGGKFGMSMTDGSLAGTENDDVLLTYIELLDPCLFHVTAVNGFPFASPFAPKMNPAPDPSSARRIVGGYNIIWWWWKLPDRDECGNLNTPNPEDSDARLILAPPDAPPGTDYELFDPEDPDNGAPQPVITNLTPNHGRGGTRVEIIGTGFGDDANVQFDGVDAEDIEVTSQYRILATAPSHANGFANVAVINVDGVSS